MHRKRGFVTLTGRSESGIFHTVKGAVLLSIAAKNDVPPLTLTANAESSTRLELLCYH